MNIGALYASLGVDSTQLDAAAQKMQQFATKAETSISAVNSTYKTQMGLIEEIEDHLEHLQDAQRKATRYEDVVRYNKKIAETKYYLKEYQTAGMAAAATTDTISSRMRAANNAMSSIGNTLMRIARTIVVAFSIHAIARFSKEAMQLAAEAEGVRSAFMKIGDSVRVLEDVKKATRGVIEESDLMALVIKAQNFRIPLQDLAKYLDFATKRAIMTGASIKELTEKIVMGVGRQNTRSFVQLGISVKDIQEAIKKTGGYVEGMGLIINRELARMGDVADTAGVKYGRMAANIKNLKEAWGDFLNTSKLISKAVEVTTINLQMAADEHLNWFAKLLSSTDRYKRYLEDLRKSEEALAIVAAESGKKTAEIIPVKAIETLNTLKEKLQEAEAALGDMDLEDVKAIALQRQVIAGYQQRIDAVTKMAKAINLYKLELDRYETHLRKVTKEMKIPEFEEPIDYQKFFMKTYVSPMEELPKKLADIALWNAKVGDSFDVAASKTQTYADQINYLQDQLAQLWESGVRPGDKLMDAYLNQLKELYGAQDKAAKSLEMYNTMGNTAADVLSDLGSALAGNASAWVSMGETVVGVLQRLLAKLLIASAAEIIEGEVSKKGLYGLITAAAGLVALSAVWEGAKSRMTAAAKMKTGGIVPPGYPNDTYPTLLTSGEAIVPPIPLTGSGGLQVEFPKGEWKMRGYDMYLTVEKQKKHLERVT